MADHEFFGTVSAQAATASDHLVQKAQLDAAAASAIARANHTGTQTVSTLSDFTTAVDARIANVIDSAPTALDTLNELAAALGDDPNFAATTASSLGALDTRIDALEAASGVGTFKQNVGDAVLSSFTVTHNLGTLDVKVEVVRISDGQTVFPVVKRPSTNTVSVDFGSDVPTSNQYRVLVLEIA